MVPSLPQSSRSIYLLPALRLHNFHLRKTVSINRRVLLPGLRLHSKAATSSGVVTQEGWVSPGVETPP